MNENKTKGYAFERYRLTLTHEFIDKEGCSHKLDLPLIINQVVEPDIRRQYGHSVFINEMLERMKEAVLKQVETSFER